MNNSRHHLIRISLVSAAFFLLTAANAMAQADLAGCADHALFPTRMAQYRISNCKTEEFGLYEFYAVKGPKTPVEGKFTFITYAFTGPRASEPSGLAVVRNYENAIKKVGGTIVQIEPQRWVNGKIAKDGHEVWAQVEKGNGLIWLRIIEKKAMEQEIVADAAAFFASARTFLPFLAESDLTPAMAGIRPRLALASRGFADFVIRAEGGDRAGLVNLVGIESPGLTAAPAIAEIVGGMLAEVAA